jgi:predicted metalloprotease with PDZ domain
MQTLNAWFLPLAGVLGLVAVAPRAACAQALDPIVYTIRIPAPDTHVAEVTATVPTGAQDAIELMMPVWSPGFYRIEDYAGKVQDLEARAVDGTLVDVDRTGTNRWRVHTRGRPAAVVSYRLACEQRSVTTNWVGEDFGVFNGAATFVTLAEKARRPHEVRLELPPQWPQSMTALDAAAGGRAHHYRAPDYDTLVDAPIVAGRLLVHEFDVDGRKHALVEVGEMGSWDGTHAARDLQKIVAETRRFWGALPYPRYLFLNVFRPGGGGLEHLDSTLLTSSAGRLATGPGYRSWLTFVSPEYFHAFNVKRLRPIELGPFDYENPPRTSSLWISEGFTSYFGELIVKRAGLAMRAEALSTLSGHIRQLQTSPGRLLQTLERSSLDVWTAAGVSGVGVDPKTSVSYYVKGAVVGFLLDARIRRATEGKRSLDDVMRLAYRRFAGARGFTPDQFRTTAEEIAGVDLKDWFRRAISSTEELDYTEALDWFGLRFAASDDPARAWTLGVRPDATDAQRGHLVAWLGQPAAVEQVTPGTRPPAAIVESFDGLGVGFVGPHGPSTGRNPSDNSLAVGPDHVFQIVNSRMAIFTKKGKKFDITGRVLYGAVPTNTLFRGFGGQCEARNNGDAVVRYDQIADRWLVVMPIFRRGPERPDQPGPWTAGATAYLSPPGVAGQPGAAVALFVPPPVPPESPAPPAGAVPPGQPAGQPGQAAQPPQEKGPYSMCYAVSASPDPLGAYYRYEFLRPLFPDYPRPAIWPDGYYVPTSTGDDVIQKHACVADRARMLEGGPATEQCIVIDGVNFLNNADLDGRRLPPAGAPNIMMATGGTQLQSDFDDDGIHVWRFHVDWKNPAGTRLIGPEKVAVAPYRYLCDGQLTNCVPQPGVERKLDAQGDKIMQRLVYRNVNGREMIVAVHSVNTEAGGGGVRWYEFRIDKSRAVRLHQQGTYAPDGFYRWMASPAIDRRGNIGIGYSFGGTPHFAGQRFAARLVDDPPGVLTLREAVLVEGEAAQTNTMRWEDYSQTAIDPSDDCTIWYVGDYYRKDATNYSTRIGAFRLPGCVGS